MEYKPRSEMTEEERLHHFLNRDQIQYNEITPDDLKELLGIHDEDPDVFYMGGDFEKSGHSRQRKSTSSKHTNDGNDVKTTHRKICCCMINRRSAFAQFFERIFGSD